MIKLFGKKFKSNKGFKGASAPLMGDVTIERAYYYMGKGNGGYIPLDESLSIPHERYSYCNPRSHEPFRNNGLKRPIYPKEKTAMERVLRSYLVCFQ